MPKGTNQKLKLYRLAQIMLENTDDEHYITMPEIPVRERCDDDSGRRGSFPGECGRACEQTVPGMGILAGGGS